MTGNNAPEQDDTQAGVEAASALIRCGTWRIMNCMAHSSDSDVRAEALGSRSLVDFLRAIIPPRVFRTPLDAWVKTVDNRMVWISPKLGAGWQLEPDRVVGVMDVDLFPETATDEYRTQDQIVIRRRRPYALEETSVDGSQWLDTVKAPILTARGHVLGTFGCSFEVPAARGPITQAHEWLPEEFRWLGFGGQPLRPPSWLRRLRRGIQSSFRERLAVRAAAHAVGVTPDHATRMFKRYYGSSISSYWHMHRVIWARNRLRTTPDTAGRVATAAGYSDQSHFTRCYKREWGRTPATEASPVRRPSGKS